jgi:hypothetical protein
MDISRKADLSVDIHIRTQQSVRGIQGLNRELGSTGSQIEKVNRLAAEGEKRFDAMHRGFGSSPEQSPLATSFRAANVEIEKHVRGLEKIIALQRQIGMNAGGNAAPYRPASGLVQDVRVTNFGDMSTALAGASLARLGVPAANIVGAAGSGYGGAGENYSRSRAEVARDQQQWARRRLAEGATPQQVQAEAEQRYGVGESRAGQIRREAQAASNPPPPNLGINPPPLPVGSSTVVIPGDSGPRTVDPQAEYAESVATRTSRPRERAEDAVRRMMAQGNADNRSYRQRVRDQIKEQYDMSRQAADAVMRRAGFPLNEAPNQNLAMGGMFHAPHMSGGGSFHERMQAVVSGSFPGATMNGRLATVMGAEGRDVQILGHENLNALQVDFGWSGESGAGKTGKALKTVDPSSLRFLDSMEAMITRAKQEGLGIKFQAEPKRANLYAQILAAHGFTQSGEGLWMPGPHMASGGRFSKLGAMLGGYAGSMIDVPLGWLGGGLKAAGAGMMGLGEWMQGGEAAAAPAGGRRGSREENVLAVMEMLKAGKSPAEIRAAMSGVSGSTADSYRREAAKRLSGEYWFGDVDLSKMGDTPTPGTTAKHAGPQQCPVCGATNPKGANYCHECGYVKHFASGGRANMTGGGVVPKMDGVAPGSDWHPAWLTNDEYVINARSARKHKALLDAVNADHGATGGQMGPDGLMHYALGGPAAEREARRRREREEEADEVDEAYERLYGGRASRVAAGIGYGGQRIAGAAGAGHMAQLMGAGGDVATAFAAGGPAGIAVTATVAALEGMKAAIEKTTNALEIMQSPYATMAQKQRALAEEFVPLAATAHKLADAIDGVNARVERSRVEADRAIHNQNATAWGQAQLRPLAHQAMEAGATAWGMRQHALPAGEIIRGITPHHDILRREQQVRLEGQDALVQARRRLSAAEATQAAQQHRTGLARTISDRSSLDLERARFNMRVAREGENMESPPTRGQRVVDLGADLVFGWLATRAYGWGMRQLGMGNTRRDRAGIQESSDVVRRLENNDQNNADRRREEEANLQRTSLQLAQARTEEQRRLVGLQQQELQLLQERSSRMRDDASRFGGATRGERLQSERALRIVRRMGGRAFDQAPGLVQQAERLFGREIGGMRLQHGERIARDFAARGLLDQRGQEDWRNGNARLGDTNEREQAMGLQIRQQLDRIGVNHATLVSQAFDQGLQRMTESIVTAINRMRGEFERRMTELNNNQR